MIQCNRLSKSYPTKSGNVEAVKHVNMSIGQGEFVAVMGPSGSGKSTLLKLIGGLEKPTEGTVAVAGQPLNELSETQLAIFRRRNTGFIFQDYNLIPGLSAMENVMLPAQLDGKKISRADAEATLESVGMLHRRHQNATQLSGGEKQRIAIARALSMNPPVILADEPTASLDSQTGQKIVALLRNVRDDGKTVVMVTHDYQVAALADRIVQLKDGAIIDDFRQQTVSSLSDSLKRYI